MERLLVISIPVVLVVSVCLSAIGLRIIVKLHKKFDVPFTLAIVAVIAVMVATLLIVLLFLTFVRAYDGSRIDSISILVCHLLAASGIYGMLIKDPESEKEIGFWYGLLISATLFPIYIAMSAYARLLFFATFAAP
jgi:hypothetical protein